MNFRVRATGLLIVLVCFIASSADASACRSGRPITSVLDLEESLRVSLHQVSSFIKGEQQNRKEAEKALCVSRKQVSDLLKSRGYRHKEELIGSQWRAAFGSLEITYFRILPDSNSRIGKLATRLNRDFGVKVVYAPLLLELIGGKGAFIEMPSSPLLVITNDTIFLDSLENLTNAHEMMHMKFWAFRKGLSQDDLLRAPVHISYQSEVAINPEAKFSIYQEFMSFEELATFALNVANVARQITRFDSASSQVRSELLHEIEKLKVVSENALVAVEKALEILKWKSAESMDYPGRIKGQYFEIADSGFSFRVFLPAPVVRKCRPDCGGAIRNEIQRARRLAEFNRRYFDSEASSPEETWLKAKDFQERQNQFITENSL